MKNIVIFLGPSLPIAEARKVLDAIYLPPAAQSDLISAVATYSPDIIGLIDGVFYHRPSVWHKEILYALEQGIAVYGASSIGALRAAETSVFGTVGVGEIYRMYTSGELIDDDEVALTYGSEDTGYRPLSEPMVNIRATFYRARDETIISTELCEQLNRIAKSIYFPERTFPAIFRQAKTLDISSKQLKKLTEFVKANYVDLKKEDALLLLQKIRDVPDDFLYEKPNFTLATNHFFAGLYHRDRTVVRNDTKISFADISEYAALHLPNFSDTNFNALNQALVQIFSKMLGIEISEEEIDRESKRFRMKSELTQETAFIDWLKSNDLSSEEFKHLMGEIACCRRLHQWLLSRKAYEKNITILLNQLRLQNQYEECANNAAIQEQILQENYPNLIEEDYKDIKMPDLVADHLSSTDCQIDIDYIEWANEAGFLYPGFLKMALIKSRLARGNQQSV